MFFRDEMLETSVLECRNGTERAKLCPVRRYTLNQERTFLR